jgi:acyl-coenzyme A thioesterase 9
MTLIEFFFLLLVPTVVPTTEEERELNTDALLNRERRKKRARESLDVKAPTLEEGQLIHNLFMDRRRQQPAPGQSFDLQSTKRQSVIVMQPQKRNIHNKIFGGYLMRLAFEHAWATAWVFTGAQPHFRAVDEINFLQPVEIGTICTFNSSTQGRAFDSVLF